MKIIILLTCVLLSVNGWSGTAEQKKEERIQKALKQYELDIAKESLKNKQKAEKAELSAKHKREKAELEIKLLK